MRIESETVKVNPAEAYLQESRIRDLLGALENPPLILTEKDIWFVAPYLTIARKGWRYYSIADGVSQEKDYFSRKDPNSVLLFAGWGGTNEKICYQEMDFFRTFITIEMTPEGTVVIHQDLKKSRQTIEYKLGPWQWRRQREEVSSSDSIPLDEWRQNPQILKELLEKASRHPMTGPKNYLVGGD